MGAGYSCASAGSQLQCAVHEGDAQVVAKVLTNNPSASVHHTLLDRTTAMHVASAKGHADVVMMLLETAVAVEGPVRAKKLCIDHVNASGESALMLASMNGHADCVEVLLGNGADPLRRDYNTHNTCLHFAALNGHTNCVAALLSNAALYEAEYTGVAFPVAQYPCSDDDGVSLVKFVDRHNGWGLTALHLAAMNGSATTVRALLRGGAALVARTATPGLAGAPSGCPTGATALHLAAKFGHIGVMRVLLEEQDLHALLDIRTVRDDLQQLPIDYARAAGQNPILIRLLDEAVPVSSMRRLWQSSSNAGMPALSSVLEMLLHRLKLMLTLDMAASQARRSSSGAQQAQSSSAGSEAEDLASAASCSDVEPAEAVLGGAAPAEASTHVVRLRQLQAAINGTLDLLHKLVQDGNAAATVVPDRQQLASNPGAETSSWLIDLLLASLVSPREVSAILRGARSVIATSQLAPETAAVQAGSGPSSSSRPQQQSEELPEQQPDAASSSSAGTSLQQLESALLEVHGCLQAGIAGVRSSCVGQGAAAGPGTSSRYRGGLGRDAAPGRGSTQVQPDASSLGTSKPNSWSWSQLSLSLGRSQSTGVDSDVATDEEVPRQHAGSASDGAHSACEAGIVDDGVAAAPGLGSAGWPSSSCPAAQEANVLVPALQQEQAHLCPICMDRRVSVSIQSCRHTMCLHCAFQICCKGRQAPLCPFCRQPICSFIT